MLSMEIDSLTKEEEDHHQDGANNYYTGISLPPAYPSDYLIPGNITRYGFQIDEWIKHPPPPAGPDWFRSDERYRRDANAHAYRQYGDIANWNQYLQLGVFVFEDCKEFDKLWAAKATDPLSTYRSIWYNFMVHVDNDIDIPPKRNVWAMQISHEYTYLITTQLL